MWSGLYQLHMIYRASGKRSRDQNEDDDEEDEVDQDEDEDIRKLKLGITNSFK